MNPAALQAPTEVIYGLLKRSLDFVASLAMLILFAPLMLIIAVAIKLDSPGPVFHIQRRGGLDGRLFSFIKFRSMTSSHDHTEEHRKFAEAYINGKLPAHDGYTHEGQPIFKPASNYLQITHVGRWLRRTSLDELPQLFNVIKGDMSLVGPRPSMDYEVAIYTDRHRQRLAVLPGLTGWAQIHGRSSLTFDDIVGFDLEYIHHRSLTMDLRIVLATVPLVLRAEHAG